MRYTRFLNLYFGGTDGRICRFKTLNFGRFIRVETACTRLRFGPNTRLVAARFGLSLGRLKLAGLLERPKPLYLAKRLELPLERLDL